MLVRRKRTIVTLVLTLFIADLCLNTISSATISKPQVAVGDYWNYEGYYYGANINGIVKITERTNITVENEIYDVFIEITNISGVGSYNVSVYHNITTYYRASDYAIVNLIDCFDYSSDFANVSYTHECAYSPPNDIMQYPINVGEKWHNQYTLKTINLETLNVSESTKNEYSECERDDSESAAGIDFYCHVVKKAESEEEQSNYTRMWFSSTVGLEPVKIVGYLYGQTVVSLILSSYNIANPVEPEENGKTSTPGFELIIVAIAIVFVILLKRKR